MKNPPVSINIDDLCHTLLSKVSDRAGVSVKQLVSLAVEAGINSLLKRLPTTPNHFGGNDIKRTCPTGNKKVMLDKSLWQTVRDCCGALEIPPQDFLRDCILAQKANFDRLHPVNARNFSSARIRLFQLENHKRPMQAGNNELMA